ncbi:hypothetical protein MUA03_13655 [Enterobacteriaceae bacterium H16N7]|nr:hypothetical protein [Dryocola clanedunensis]
MDNMIIGGVRIYFPTGNYLPSPSSDMRTFAVVNYKLPGYVLLEFKGNGWVPTIKKIFAEAAFAISAAVKLTKYEWK